MTRNGFIGSIVGLIASPFVKRNVIQKPITLDQLERATFTNMKEKQEEFLSELSGKFVVNGSDLVAVLDREKLYRGERR